MSRVEGLIQISQLLASFIGHWTHDGLVVAGGTDDTSCVEILAATIVSAMSIEWA